MGTSAAKRRRPPFRYYLIFGILAVQLWNGKLKTCTDATIVVRENCTGPFFDVSFNETRSRQWRSMNTNFDHIGTAVLALFEVSAANSWEVIMWSAMDAVVGLSRAKFATTHPLYGLFFVVFFAIKQLLSAEPVRWCRHLQLQ